MEDRRKTIACGYSPGILQNEEQYHALSRAHDDIVGDGELVTITTRTATKENPRNWSSTKRNPQQFPATHYSCFVIRDMKLKVQTNHHYKTARCCYKCTCCTCQKNRGFSIDWLELLGSPTSIGPTSTEVNWGKFTFISKTWGFYVYHVTHGGCHLITSQIMFLHVLYKLLSYTASIIWYQIKICI